MATDHLSTPSNTPATREEWDAAFAAYLKIDAEADAALAAWNAARDRYIELTGRDTHIEPFDKEAAEASGFTALNENIDDEGERVSEAIDALIQLPAPDAAALLWKLNYIIASEIDDEGEGGSTPCWSGAFVAQTIADMRRILGGEA